jgi:hypothetical protein
MFYVEQFFGYLSMKKSLAAYSKSISSAAPVQFPKLHKQLHIQSSLRLVLISISSLFLLSCERPMDNPESVDRIFNDLNQDSKSVQTLINSEKKTLEDIEKDISATKSGDNSIKTKFRKKYESEHKIQALEQSTQYLKLRALTRKEYVSKVYPKYFEKKIAWPDNEEWKDYQSSKRLNAADRDWNHRVPKLGKHIKDYNAKAAAEFHTAPEKKEAKKEGEEKGSGEKKPTEAKPAQD